MKQVWSFGGGRQSCGLAALIIQGKFEKPDIAVMSDTGREKQRTWDYLNRFVVPGLHRSLVPLSEVDLSQPADLFNDPCDSGLCFT